MATPVPISMAPTLTLSWAATSVARPTAAVVARQDSVARLLEVITVEHASNLVADASARRAFESLLEALVATANKRASVLTAKLRSGAA